ncbi:MAG: hypothetical protein R3E01_09675 [Pirellulaceae bacterium]|nr:hypothetical protein [Planctomycetales bacterium]
MIGLARAWSFSFLAVATWAVVSCVGIASLLAIEINIPPDPHFGDDQGIGTGTTVNVFGGGQIGRSFEVGAIDHSSQDVILNVAGGVVGGELHANGGSVVNVSLGTVGDDMVAKINSQVNISGGTVGFNFVAETNSSMHLSGGLLRGDVVAHTDSVIDISGGTLGPFTEAGLPDGSSSNVEVNISGGYVGGGFNANGGSRIVMTGGVLGNIFGSGGDSFNAYAHSLVNIFGGVFDYDFDTFEDSNVHLHGGEFMIDDQPAPVEVPITLSSWNILTGVLSDGTPFAIGAELDDEIWPQTVTLHEMMLPPIEATVIHVPPETAPKSIRAGQTLHVHPTGNVGDFFRAGPGSAIVMDGGQLGNDSEVRGATVTLIDGTIGESFRLFGNAVFDVRGGRVRDFMDVGSNAVVNVSGGQIGIGARFGTDTVANISAGVIGSFFQGDEVLLSGGVIGSTFSANALTVEGGEFLLDGEAVSGLENPGNSVLVALNAGVLSGILTDGTPFAFSTQYNDSFGGAIRLIAAELPDVGPAVIDASTGVIPSGLRDGQTLNVGVGANVNSDMVAGPGSVVNVDGGEFAGSLRTVGAMVNISGGGNVSQVIALTGTRVELSDGVLGGGSRLGEGAELTVSGGEIRDRFESQPGSLVKTTDGVIGRDVLLQGDVSIEGGQFGDQLRIFTEGTVDISGGTFGKFWASKGTINLYGTEFQLDGASIADLVPNTPVEIAQRGVTLTGTFADGSVFDFQLNGSLDFNSDFFLSNAMLNIVLVDAVHLPGDFSGNGVVDAADYTVWKDTFGSTTELGADGNHNEIIDAADYTVWKDNFGRSAAGGGSVAVPESGTMTFMVFVIATIARQTRGVSVKNRG